MNKQLDVAALQASLVARVAGEVRFDRLSRALYATDASVYQIVPMGVVLPRSEADIVAALQACARFGVPLTARGGGTSQAGQAIGPGLILDCSKYYHHVLEIHEGERWVRVQPGCVLDDLNLVLKPLGLQLALDISTADRATIGGMIANNSAGTRSIVYGKTIDHVLELKVLLADGTILRAGPLTPIEYLGKCQQEDREGECYRGLRRLAKTHAAEIDRRYPRVLRRVGGYNLDMFTGDRETVNLAHLFVGSEGTLGITLEAKLRLRELPRAKAVLVIQFADLLAALAATPTILAHQPSAVEVMDQYILDCTKQNAEAARLRGFLQGEPGAILIVELLADEAADLPPRLAQLEADLRQHNLGYHCHRALAAAEQAQVWKLRRLALGLSMAEKGDAKASSFVEDTAVAAEHLRDYIAEFLGIISRHGTRAGIYAHASVGCLHVRPVVNLKTAEGLGRFQAIAGDVAELVLKYGGALSGEHGDGLVRSPFQEKMYGPELYQAFRELKQTFDPHSLLNPGKIVDAPPLTANLRYGPAYVTPELPTTFAFTAEGGIVRAAELCAGVGECRKKRGGVMCPSYQATAEEMHSTRGRANALRLALTGQLGFAGLQDPALGEVLDLCLECKSCKSECPTNVDMARLKAEVLHQQQQRTGGVSWRRWLFGNVANLGRWGRRFPTLANWWLGSPAGRWLNEVLFGIDRRRTLPAFARRTHGSNQANKDPAQFASQVLLFPDTFIQHYEPNLGQAATELLRRAGCWVIEQPPGSNVGFRCCGRPLISNGLLTEAVANARHNVELLWPWAEAGKPIVACEPSCILTIKDDYPALLRGEWQQKAVTVAAACRTVEEVLIAPGPENKALLFKAGPKKVLVQGHCHQRSLVGMGPMLALLRKIPGAEVVDLDAGCCGMAGAFGYEKEHYEISRQIGEQRLFPAIRQAESSDVLVAPGFSCRRQIEHFTGRKVQHPLELLWELLEGREP